MDWGRWSGTALVVGAGGLGHALVAALASRAPGLRVWATSRDPERALAAERAGAVRVLPLDVRDGDSLDRLGEAVLAEAQPLRLVIVALGVLHGEGLSPEKRLDHVTFHSLERVFAVNAFGPLLLARALAPAMPRDQPCQFASLSARVGSIGDNRSGGWYSYRAAKAAQNQLLTCLALEWRRRRPQTCVTLLHPGTTDTPLSRPFQASVPQGRLFTPERAAGHLLDVLQAQTPERSGDFLAWDGQAIPW
ncbi:SDR family NAD(P)-dependent oxidoreductase [Synechococcus sp. RSCCF101]|uniref:SDR family NAD(P)-dependent oxidoreductase n=1 Tax=Synechococcus sp. RSCCF101 TaxID=2511069 RepID=UPI0012455128|nr:SDR family NAD(P)-dependent oxidoreductase [Synechococcus sp. RSCCF101]QEY31732.1 SDR family NAD(P)-dependent oxidoreductase [Synechococcus sp. RSCCF101]